MMQQNTFKQTEVGRIPEDWAVYRLSDVVDIIGGGTPKTRVEEYWNGDIPWLSVVDFNGELRWVHDTDKTITQRGLEESSTKLLKKGQLIISARGTVGEIAQLCEDMAFNQSCYGLNGKEMLINDFLYCLLKYNVVELKTKTHGSVFDTITRKTFEQINVALPPILEQKRIAKILSDLDQKISLNHQINQTLESMAQTIFKSWFVNFDPVKAKIAALEAGKDAEGVTRAAMRAISGKTDDELDQMHAGQPENYAQLKTTAGLFPVAMQDSELGEVPEGWDVKAIGDVVKVVGGGTPSTKNSEYWDGGSHCWTTPKDLSGISSPVLLDTARKVTDAGLAKISCGLLPAGTFLLSSRAPVGYTAIAQVPLAVNQGYIAIPPSGQLSSLFLLHWTRINLETIKGRACGTTFQEISKKNFRPIKITVPTAEILTKFDTAAGSLFERVVVNEQESRSLIVIRDALLPKLISGKIRVK